MKVRSFHLHSYIANTDVPVDAHHYRPCHCHHRDDHRRLRGQGDKQMKESSYFVGCACIPATFPSPLYASDACVYYLCALQANAFRFFVSLSDT